MSQAFRSHTCGELRVEHVGQRVTLAGWVHRRRDHGHLAFFDLRDRYGITQVVTSADESPEAHAAAEPARSEWVVQVEGTVRHRPEGTTNAELATGEVEVAVDRFAVLNPSKVPPFYINEEQPGLDEALRLKHRYLDLRRPPLQGRLLLRARLAGAIRRTLEGVGFVDVETPTLIRSTPEGARDFVVPSRLQHGKFYALPQSPQVLKQLLMVAGYDRYYQLARAYRDELTDVAMRHGARGLVHLSVQADGSVHGPAAKFLSDAHVGAVKEATSASPGDLLLIVADTDRVAAALALGHVRLEMGDRLGLRDPNVLGYVWVHRFPMFQW